MGHTHSHSTRSFLPQQILLSKNIFTKIKTSQRPDHEPKPDPAPKSEAAHRRRKRK
ncbi:MAG: hypothetical protein WC506_01370 [Candidatus Micrarchaeia archaeon]